MRVLKVLIAATVAGVLVAGAIIFLAGAGPNDPHPIPLFGISADDLAKDGIYAYPAGSGEHIPEDRAQALARGGYQREDKIKGSMLVRLVLPAQGFDGLAWAVRWDVDGQPAYLPGGGDAIYNYSLTFIDAKTGEELRNVVDASGKH